jgi:TRAP-type uncharacterized transport system substrate-binding protein
MLGLRLPRLAASLIAGVFLVIALLLVIFYLWSPRAALRITTGPSGGIAHNFISAFVSVTTALHPHIRIETVPVPDLKASSKALEDHRVNIALVRSDVRPPVNGQTLVILRRDVIAIIFPPKSPIKNMSDLSDKTIAIPAGPVQDYNSCALDTILGYYNVAPAAVKRVFLPISEIGPAIHRHLVAAALAVGPIGPGDSVDVVASLAKATKRAPEILAIEEGDAIAKHFPALETIDIPEGAFKGHPRVPDDTVRGLAVTYRFVVPSRYPEPLHSSAVEELRQRCKRQPRSSGIKDHLLLWRAIYSTPRSLVREELDEHFGFPVVGMVEQANHYFRTRLHTLLEAA